MGDVEEKLHYAIQINDRVMFAESLKEYVIVLAKREDFGRLKHFLLSSILEDRESPERRYLDSIGISPVPVFRNSLNILLNLKVNSDVTGQLQTVIEYYDK